MLTPKLKSRYPVARSGEHTIQTGENVPIIFVPGIMGSRLELVDSERKWNPDSDSDMLWLAISYTSTKRAALHFDEVEATLMERAEGLTPDQQRRHWGHAARDFYRTGLESLERLNLSPHNCPVYVAGYDWRQDNAVSAEALKSAVDAILATESATQAILISHSMGGLVTRSALLDSGFKNKVRGIIHLMQPTTGGPTFYRRFFTGMTGDLGDGGTGITRALGNAGWRFAMLTSVLPGAIQLAPNEHYTPEALSLTNSAFEATSRSERASTSKCWLQSFDSASNEFTDLANGIPWTDLYPDENSPPGLLNPTGLNDRPEVEQTQFREDLSNRLTTAQEFHAALGLERHSETFSLFSSGLNTDIGTVVDPTPIPGSWPWTAATPPPHQGVIGVRAPNGDGTVPETSGAALFPNQALDPSSDLLGEERRQFMVPSVAHDSPFASDEINEWIARSLRFILTSNPQT